MANTPAPDATAETPAVEEAVEVEEVSMADVVKLLIGFNDRLDSMQRQLDERPAVKGATVPRHVRQRQLEQQMIRSSPKCRVRWSKTPQIHSCQIGNTAYGPADAAGRQVRHGPLRDRTTSVIVQGGTEEWMPAPHAELLEASGYLEVLEGREHIRTYRSDQVSTIDLTVPRTEREAEALLPGNQPGDHAETGLLAGVHA
jgi:hypothetical protein